jgi:starvation-inducible outer membrane lipoprotein
MKILYTLIFSALVMLSGCINVTIALHGPATVGQEASSSTEAQIKASAKARVDGNEVKENKVPLGGGN